MHGREHVHGVAKWHVDDEVRKPPNGMSALPPEAVLFDTAVVFERKTFQEKFRRLAGNGESWTVVETGTSALPVTLVAYGEPFTLRVELDRSRVERARGVRLLATTWQVLESIAALEGAL